MSIFILPKNIIIFQYFLISNQHLDLQHIFLLNLKDYVNDLLKNLNIKI